MSAYNATVTRNRVSIHAPLRGATPLIRAVSMARVEFQSTPPCGGRRPQGKHLRKLKLFQSTPPCGGRPSAFTSTL